MKKIVILLTLLSIWALAEVKVGDSINLELVDQFDKPHTLNSKAYKKIVVTFEKDISQKINLYLQDQEKDLLKTKKIAYISDIHKMPSFVTSMFALPKMKKYTFPILLIKEKNNIFPSKENHITVVHLHRGKIKKIEFKEEKLIKIIF